MHVDTSLFYPLTKNSINKNKIKLITVGRLNKVKGQIYALQVVNKLIKKGYSIELFVVGEGSERGVLEKYIYNNNLKDYIFLLGVKSQNEIVNLLRSSDLFIFTSVSLHQGKSTETQGLATVEAAACGLPVVVFDSGGVKYTLENGYTGLMSKEYDIDSMAENIELLITNSDLYEKMSQNAVFFVEDHYSKKIINGKWEKIYN